MSIRILLADDHQLMRQGLHSMLDEQENLEVVAEADDGAPKPLAHASRAILFRAVRELLINVAKHAGVGTAHVAARRTDDNLLITVSDAGVGFDQKQIEAKLRPGFGLVSVRERLAFIGGSLALESVPGDGTLATLIAPLETEEQAAEETPT